jgi:hypothetical protein
MDQLKDTESQVAEVAERVSTKYVPPFQLTKGQPPPIAANGGLSYMSFDRDGDGGNCRGDEGSAGADC